MNHPSELKLERHLLDPERSDIGGHVRECDRCRERVAQMRQQGEDFRRFVYPATLDKVSEPRFSFKLRGLWLLAPAAGLATVLLLVRPGPTSDYVGTKGDAVALTAYAALDSGTRPVDDGQAVPASASLRFRVRAKEPCELTLLSVDESGQVSKLYSREVRGDITLPGGVKLDGKPGAERFFAVCAENPASVEQAARKIGGEVRKILSLPGVRGPQASLLIEKRP